MSEKKQTYLEQQLEAVIKKENNKYTFTFQRGKIKLDDAIEMDMLKEIDPSIQKEIILTDDELNLIIQLPSNYLNFFNLKNKDEKSKWIFAHQLVKKVQNHSLSRLHLVVCPENIVLDQSLTPYFLHYGVKESLPPYERDSDKLWHEVKATVAAAVDGKYTFNEYFNFYKTIELSPLATKLMTAKDEEELLQLIFENMKQLEKKEKTLVHITKKKWNITRYIALGLFICLLPAIIYTLYSLIFLQPKQTAFVKSQEYFLKDKYSEVVSTLADYKVDDMPNVVLYELALSYVINESLTEEQREYVQTTITLQSDPQYLKYWIHIGRGSAKKALEIARTLEDRDLIVFALIKYREAVKADDKLKSEEKQEEIKKIEAEIEEYKKQKEAEEEEVKRKQEEEQKAEQENAGQATTEQPAEEQPAEEQPAEQTDAPEQQESEEASTESN
ncbi:type VII secretion protein EssB [Bacillus aquiflavi]|uniref:Type VII secretion protein EssB n=1 Tax=Bacillus aquiflavi TaxID=2672567 RepID=A0A6B3W480_9BACI|nr:type VII secretion protein EssB [Bacillus aquiflavi]MBA4536975.1 type VII secretion protein EssB [Bacillus aquiflavi]NEY82671.1 type VII secretion protein EssB [Bacillus aquiflavi]UAC47787.1 type VII secretion protein EssB [Bacillus aquiflavi]